MTTTMILLLCVAAVVIFSLATYATVLLLKLREQNKQQLALAEEQRLKHNAKDLKIINSVVLIGKAMEQEQCEISEGCWRLSVLIESMENGSEEIQTQFPAIFKLYSKIKHMPILDARKELTKKDRLTLDLERMGHEQEFESAVMLDVKNLVPYAENLQQELNQQ
ncbi:DUF2489 domain-containing protein [Thalassotalea crassostreae]|uniref:DUF2489 domain-containing protein n=1 Tax=Thalassotalea crassostreae TaxID=1763536 RepID=UPI00083991CB|nr:DUF2489 domain-containing protein [Thalassotalea crassostreae]